MMVSPTPTLSVAEVIDAITMRKESGASYRDIAEKLKCSPETVRRLLRRYNVRVSGVTRKRPQQKPPEEVIASPRAHIFQKLFPY